MKLDFPYYDELTNTVDWAEIDKLDWIQGMKGVEQDLQWHGEGDVYNHTKMVVEAILSLPEFVSLTSLEKHILVSAGLLHDVEKRSTSEMIDGHIRSHGHSRKGEYTARGFLYREVPCPFDVRETICSLVRNHGTPLYWDEAKDVNRYVIEASMKVNTKLVYLLSKADILGRIAEDTTSQLEQIEMFKELCIENGCFGIPYVFKSDLGRIYYFTHEEAYPDFEPFDESKFEVILMSGLAGAGKDYYVMQELCHLDVISLDDIREEMGVKHGDSKGQGHAIQEAKERAKKLMRAGTSFVWNATNITKQMRGQLIDLFTSYGGKVRIIYIETPYENLIKQNAQRIGMIPEAAVDKMINKLEIPTNIEAPIVTYIFKNGR